MSIAANCNGMALGMKLAFALLPFARRCFTFLCAYPLLAFLPEKSRPFICLVFFRPGVIAPFAAVGLTKV
jgi:hypothetical protein